MNKKTEQFVLVVPSDPQQIAKVEPFLSDVNRHAGLNEDAFNKLLISVTEAVNNGILHGNKRDPKKTVTLTCVINGSVLTIRVHDQGTGFNPDVLPDPLAIENLLREHGRGVFLIRSMMDSVTFEKTEHGSDVIMTMKL